MLRQALFFWWGLEREANSLLLGSVILPSTTHPSRDETSFLLPPIVRCPFRFFYTFHKNIHNSFPRRVSPSVATIISIPLHGQCFSPLSHASTDPTSPLFTSRVSPISMSRSSCTLHIKPLHDFHSLSLRHKEDPVHLFPPHLDYWYISSFWPTQVPHQESQFRRVHLYPILQPPIYFQVFFIVYFAFERFFPLVSIMVG